MRRCLDLASDGLGHTYPNPLVGCVIVSNGKVIGEGFHRRAGGPHAEVEAINTVNDQALLSTSTLYVNLEPCAHFGSTPPCADLIVRMRIPRVVISNQDPFQQVNGKGIQRLRDAGTEVITGVLEAEGAWMNRRFFTYHMHRRPYVILKWAQSADRYMDPERTAGDKGSFAISGPESRRLVHLWRSQEQAILVGSRTVEIDNPLLTVREVSGRNPTRVIPDRYGRTPPSSRIFDQSARTILLTENEDLQRDGAELLYIESSTPQQWLRALHEAGIQSVLVEGGATILNLFLHSGLYDEMRVITSPRQLKKGLHSPEVPHISYREFMCGSDRVALYKNTDVSPRFQH